MQYLFPTGKDGFILNSRNSALDQSMPCLRAHFSPLSTQACSLAGAAQALCRGKKSPAFSVGCFDQVKRIWWRNTIDRRDCYQTLDHWKQTLQFLVVHVLIENDFQSEVRALPLFSQTEISPTVNSQLPPFRLPFFGQLSHKIDH